MLALGEAFTQALNSELADVYDYQNIDNFQKLWNSNGFGIPTVLNEQGSPKNIIIVWDGRERQNGDPARQEDDPAGTLLERHLTPLDWALSLSIKVLVDPACKEKRDFRISIVDLTGKVHDEWAMRMRFQLLAEMPWVTLYAPLIPEKDGDAAGYRKGYRPMPTEQNGWTEELSAPGKINLAGQEARLRNLEELAKQWVASLTQSEDHHDVNNVIGADILSMPNQRRVGVFGAFLTRLEWSGQETESLGKWEPWDASVVRTKLFKNALNVLVVDDQLAQGWGRFVCRLLGNSKYNGAHCGKEKFTKLNETPGGRSQVEVHGCLGPDPLLRFLEDRAVFDKREYGSNVMGTEIILLDLRLYPKTQDAKTHARRLLKVVNTRAQGSLAWKPIDSEEIGRIRGWCEPNDQGVGNPGPHVHVVDEALLLLPRLLALALPLTPIILFSSTGRPWIRERLKPYQNIFTGFEKPRVLVDKELVNGSIDALRKGLSKAVDMVRLRLQLAYAQYAANEEERSGIGDAQQECGHIEIYADETRTTEEGITSGLAVCLYPDEISANALQGTFLSELGKDSGAVWEKESGSAYEPGLSKGCDISRDGASCERQVQKLADLLDRSLLEGHKRKLWSVVATRVPAWTPPVNNPVSLAAFPDGPLDDALRFNLEFTLYVLIPRLLGDSFSGSVQIHLPTRVVSYDVGRGDAVFIKKLCEAFDLGKPMYRRGDGSWLVPTASLGNARSGGALGSAFPLVRGWLHEWRHVSNPSAERIVQIRMATLRSNTRGDITRVEATNRRLFHDVADWACTASGQLHDREHGEWVWPLHLELEEQGVFCNWFISTDGQRVRKKSWYEADFRNAKALMGALKASCNPSRPGSQGNDALRFILSNGYVSNCKRRLITSEHCRQQRLILWKLRDELRFAHGGTLHSLLPADATDSNEVANGNDHPSGDAPTVSPIEAQGEYNAEACELMDEDVPQGGAESPAIAPSPHNAGGPLSDIFLENELDAKFPNSGLYEGRIAKFWIMLNRCGPGDALSNHSIDDRGLLLQLKAPGWATPLRVCGIEYDQPLSGSGKGLRVVAAKLGDGRWKMIGG